MMRKLIILNLFLLFFTPFNVFAHSGRTDSSGCHTCRTNCASWGLSTGEYHCHQAKSLPQPEEPIKSTYGANGTGYTTPAPEYQTPKSTVLPVTLNTTTSTNQNNIDSQIKSKVNNEKSNYTKNPHLFREKLITKLEKEFGKNSLIGNYVYSLLGDIK